MDLLLSGHGRGIILLCCPPPYGAVSVSRVVLQPLREEPALLCPCVLAVNGVSSSTEIFQVSHELKHRAWPTASPMIWTEDKMLALPVSVRVKHIIVLCNTIAWTRPKQFIRQIKMPTWVNPSPSHPSSFDPTYQHFPSFFLSIYPSSYRPFPSFCQTRIQDMAADSCVLDAMDKLWFFQNIIFFEPDVVSLRSKLTTPISISSSSSADENPSRQSSAYKDKSPTRLDIVVGQPLFQLQRPPKSKIQSHSSSPALNTGQVKHPTSKKRPGVKSYRSLSELENYELKGFMDLGFTFPKGKPSAYMMSMVPGLQRLDDKDERRAIRRPYLSEAWLVNSTDSPPLINLQLLSRTPGGSVMKRQLRFWAQRVATLVHEES